jgi:ADP-L-glycero-D-manno-heptose 6-epimerase
MFWWNWCATTATPLIYASSAATYGDGSQDFIDDQTIESLEKLAPLNLYGWSKHQFDKWAVERANEGNSPPQWVGIKFFNVYGPNEYHKGRMASVIFHSFNQIKEKGSMNLFRSHNPNFTDGGQMRDFVYVKDLINVCYFLMHHRKNSGIYNLGSGKARTFLDLVTSTFTAMDKEPVIGFIDTPADIRDKYQYFTEANMSKLFSIGYPHKFHTLEEGVTDYVTNYLMPHKYL